MTSTSKSAFPAEGRLEPARTSGAPRYGAKVCTGAGGHLGVPDETSDRRKCPGTRCGIAVRPADPA